MTSAICSYRSYMPELLLFIIGNFFCQERFLNFLNLIILFNCKRTVMPQDDHVSQGRVPASFTFSGNTVLLHTKGYVSVNANQCCSINIAAPVLLNVIVSLRFLYVEVGHHGSESDGGVFARCNFLQNIAHGRTALPVASAVGNIVLPYYFVGDEAFPLKTFVMRPFARKSEYMYM